jgi:hypothetical protein
MDALSAPTSTLTSDRLKENSARSIADGRVSSKAQQLGVFLGPFEKPWAIRSCVEMIPPGTKIVGP